MGTDNRSGSPGPEPWMEPFPSTVTERIVQWPRARASQWPVRRAGGFGCRVLVARRSRRRREIEWCRRAAGSRLRVRPVMDGVPRAPCAPPRARARARAPRAPRLARSRSTLRVRLRDGPSSPNAWAGSALLRCFVRPRRSRGAARRPGLPWAGAGPRLGGGGAVRPRRSATIERARGML